MILRAGSFAILACLALAACADSPPDKVTIPLKDIWALDMPGTRDVKELSSKEVPVSKIEEQLNLDTPGQPQPIGPADEGFAVVGIDKDALKKIYEVLVEKKQPEKTFESNDDISIVFFARLSGSYVHLKSVEWYGDVINIQYVFVPHNTKELTDHFALIPLGHLDAGRYRVQITQLPNQDRGDKSIDKTWTEKLICQPFGFSVKGQN